MVSEVIPFRRATLQRDWTNEELAELYRVEHALHQARVALETDRGITDEGDPWFVFCRPEGEVLVHIARSDGQYHLFSPALPHPLKGPSFSALTKSFVDTIPAPMPLEQGRNGRVVMHPAAMLSILVVTIFFAVDVIAGHSAQASEIASPDGSLALGDSEPLLDGQAPETQSGFLKEVFLKTVSTLGDTRTDPAAAQNSAYLSLVAAVVGFSATSHDSQITAASLLEGDAAGMSRPSHDASTAPETDAASVRQDDFARYHAARVAHSSDASFNSELNLYTPYGAVALQLHLPADAGLPKLAGIALDVARFDTEAWISGPSGHASTRGEAPSALAAIAAPTDTAAGDPPAKHPTLAPLPPTDKAASHDVSSASQMKPPTVSAEDASVGVRATPIPTEPRAASNATLSLAGDSKVPPAKATPEAVAPEPSPAPAASPPPPPSEEDIVAAVDKLVGTIKSHVSRGSVDYSDLLKFVSSDAVVEGDVPSGGLSWNDKVVLWDFELNSHKADNPWKQYDTEAKLLIDAFLKNAHNAEFLVRDKALIILEDPDHPDSSYGMVHTWTLDGGGSITLIGLADRPEPAL